MRVPRSIRPIACDTSGATIIEFAIVAPVFLAVLVAILQVALVYLAQDGLEGATETASRLLATGQAQQAGMNAAQFQTAACSSLPSYMNCSGLMVDVRTASSFSSADTGMPVLTYDSNGNVTTSFAYTPGGQAAIVVVRFMYLWPTSSGPLGFNISNQPGGKRLLLATSVFKSEYY
ncbi:TadE/TadG family type IV pilus assembly protein [Novosphingobium sp. KA1]|uniref:TadE/TadG family type IV pilus assembly protein n=1 Tax=Novosphingobium sp. (strain KA1) TaxID=164608 RepID=UPI001A8E6B39|nr:TadE/TadG family type IV pilus assembly protein [Novosphingobium sp. KA1]QSR18106.1 pilus assembly protein TadE [Novosphingobium sp. KA1]